MAKPNQSKLKKLILGVGDDYLQEWTQNHDINLLSLTQLAMIIAESSSKSRTMTGAEKCQLAKTLVPVILKTFRENGFITKTQENEIATKIDVGSTIIEEFIPLMIEIAKNPLVIQAANQIEDLIQESGCCGPCGKGKKKTPIQVAPGVLGPTIDPTIVHQGVKAALKAKKTKSN